MTKLFAERMFLAFLGTLAGSCALSCRKAQAAEPVVNEARASLPAHYTAPLKAPDSLPVGLSVCVFIAAKSISPPSLPLSFSSPTFPFPRLGARERLFRRGLSPPASSAIPFTI